MSPRLRRPLCGRVPFGKRLSFLTFILALITCLLVIGMDDDSSAVPVANGTCGDDVTWDLEDGVLTISGTGYVYGISSFEYSFSDYKDSVTSVIIEEGITGFSEGGPFTDFTELISVSLPGTISNLSGHTFSGCTSLRAVILPDNLQNIWTGTLDGCTNLEKVYFSNNLTPGGHLMASISDIDFYDMNGNPLDLRYYDNVRGKAFVKVDNKLTEVPQQGLANGGINWSYSDGLLRITGTGSIGDYSTVSPPPWWGYSDVITHVFVSDSITGIGENAFLDCPGVKVYYLGSGLTDIGGGNLDGTILDYDGTTPLALTADALKGGLFLGSAGGYVKVAPHNNLNGSVGWSFSNGTLNVYGTGSMDDYDDGDQQPWGEFRGLISEIIVSEGVTHIGDMAFTFCGNATSVTIADTVTSIGVHALSYTTDLNTVVLPAGLTSIGDYAFRDSGLTSVIIPSGMTVINHGTFMYCIGLTSAEIPDTVTNIAAEGFLGCMNLKGLYMSSGLTELAEDAFTDVDLYDSDETTPMVKDVTHLRATMFVEKSNKAVRLAIDLVVDGSVCSKASDTHSASLSYDDMTYLKKRSTQDTAVQLQIMLEGGIRAVFDRAAIQELGQVELTLTIRPMDVSELSEAVRELAKDNTVYDVSFSGYNNLGNGKARITVPFTPSGTETNADLIENNAVASTLSCACADGKATFETSRMMQFFVESHTPSGGGGSGEFPLWIPVVVALIALAAAFGAVFYMKNARR